MGTMIRGSGATIALGIALLTGSVQILESSPIEFNSIASPIIFKGNSRLAFRDPTVLYYDGIFRLFYTYITTDEFGRHFWVVATSKSTDLIQWTAPIPITPRSLTLNFASPGNVVRYGDEWLLCMQTYPTPNGEKYGNEDSRIWVTRSKDLENWGPPELLRVKGPGVPVEEMGRLIDAFLIQDKDFPGKWWCFFDDNAANMSYSYDLKNWTYFNRISAGENVCIVVDGEEYLMFHSPKNGIGIKRSTDMKNWRDWGPLITLGQQEWDWAQGRLTAGFVLDLRGEPKIGRLLMFFHGSGPEDERTMFSTHSSLGLAWSKDFQEWDWAR